MKKKIIIISTIMLLILFTLPFILTKLSQPHEFMGIMIFLFFIINPITAAVVNALIGKDIKKLWYIPILFPIIFLLSYWIILSEVITDLVFYAVIYLIVGLIFMIGSFVISNLNKKGN